MKSHSGACLVISCLLGFCEASARGDGAGQDWRSYLGDEGRSHYSRLDQIHRKNVRNLEVAWTFRGGGAAPSARTQIQCNPLIIDGVMFATTAAQHAVALDAATGKEKWRFNPRADGRSKVSDPRHRGLAFWSDTGSRRIILAHDRYLYALDADTGRLVEDFGEGGSIDFGAFLADETRMVPVGSGTPGVIFEDTYIISTRTSEVAGAAPGHVMAIDVRSGQRRWTFHTIPRPGEFGYETWPPDAWKTAGGANCWAGMALDEERGLVYVPTGSPSYDFWGGDRRGDNLFGNSLVCLDARTGRRVWHYQMVRHDLWDRDLPAPPTLITVTRDGRRIAAVAQTTKSGHVFVFDRETGTPLFPIEEQASPASSLLGEASSPAQPVPVKPVPFARQTVSYEDLTTLSASARNHVLSRFANLRQAIPFQPPSLEGTIVSPGQDGGAEWGGAAADPRGILYVNGTDTPGILTLIEISEGASVDAPPGHGSYLRLCAGCHGIDRRGTSHLQVPSLLNLEGRARREDLLLLLDSGRGLMPSFAFLPETEKAALVDYILRPPSEDDVRRATGNPTGYRPSKSSGSPYGHVFERWTDAEGFPAVKPPWGTLNAIDLNTGEYRWTVPLGEYRTLSKRGVPLTGTPNYGGPLVTAGGVVFIAGTPDCKIRAFDREDGGLLWETDLPAAGYATPATYESGGRQYIVIACGGGKLDSPSDDVYIAFALPK